MRFQHTHVSISLSHEGAMVEWSCQVLFRFDILFIGIS